MIVLGNGLDAVFVDSTPVGYKKGTKRVLEKSLHLEDLQGQEQWEERVKSTKTASKLFSRIVGCSDQVGGKPSSTGFIGECPNLTLADYF